MKKTLLMATGALVAAGFATDAKAVDVELYGQVNKTVISADNGTNSEVTVNDNDKSSTRAGFKGEQALDNGLTASVLVEYEINGNSTAGNLSATSVNAGSTLVERHARVGLAGNFGAVFIGHTSTATDGITEIDSAGVSDLMGSPIAKLSGTTPFFNSATKATSGVTAASVNNNFDGGRSDAIAYHSPVVSGFQAQLSTTEGGDNQAAVRYSGKFDEFAVKAGIGYHMNNDASTALAGVAELESQTSGSITVKHDSGLAGTFAFGGESAESGAEASSIYAKLGYSWDAFEVAADYSKFESDATNDREGKTFGLGGQYNLGHGVSLAGAYRNLEVDDNTAVSYDDIDLIMANLRVKF